MRIVFVKTFLKKNGINVKFQVERESSGRNVFLDIMSDMDLTSTSLGSKEAVSSINNAFKNFVIKSLHSGMCKKSKLRVYRELTEHFECKKYLHGVSDMGSKLSFRFRSGTHGLNEELAIGRHSSRNSSKACFFL